MRRRWTGLVAAAVVVLAGLTPAAGSSTDRNRVVDITFPVVGTSTFSDDYDARRGGGSRRHQATDIFGPKLLPVHAANAGRVCHITGIGEPPPAYGYQITVCGDDGIEYRYIHLNNDSPGTDDGRGGAAWAYAPGMRDGVRVSRGQWIGYLGDSGNAEDTPPHLHFEMIDRNLRDPAIGSPPWQPHRLNPFNSLRAARQRGDVPTSTLREGARGPAVAEWQGQLNLVIGAGLGADGSFGPATATATRTFQQRRGLTPDGIVGPASRRAMTAALVEVGSAPARPKTGTTGAFPGRALRLTTPPLRGADVQTWQQRMRDRGWREASGAPLGVDGIFGRQSDRAARLFQQDRGLVVDGIVGPSTWSAAFGP